MTVTLSSVAAHTHQDRHPTTAHYDLDVGFFRTFLDPYLKYTCALFDETHADLDSAAVNMLDYLIDCGRLPSFPRILEIGSGWGSLTRRLCERTRCEYVGISPSGEQNAYIQKEIAPVTLLQTSFESLPLASLGKFDAIYLVGSFCHLQDKPMQLMRLAHLLAPGGRIVIEDSFFLSEALYKQHALDPRTEFLQKRVFGYAEIPSLASFTDMVRGARLRLATLKDTTDDYQRTIAAWLERIKTAPAHYRVEKALFQRYLGIAQAGWNYTTSNYVATLEALPTKGDA